MLHIEGENRNRIVKKNPESFEFPIIPRAPEDQDQNASPVPSGDSWTLETEQSPREAPLPDDDEDGGEGLENDVGVEKGLKVMGRRRRRQTIGMVAQARWPQGLVQEALTS
jgi:hypothetical protein